MPSLDLALQLDLALRLLLSAVLGAVIGYEREIHDHPAGMRTHLLVSLGSAAFTVISIYGFTNTGIANEAPTDPSRVAAQIVTGIGFLGAGAIIKYGTSVRGLTTAASLWVTAAVGMSVGAGWWLVAIVAAGQLILNVLNGPTFQHALVFVLLLSVIVTFYDRYRPIHVARFGTAENPPD